MRIHHQKLQIFAIDNEESASSDPVDPALATQALPTAPMNQIVVQVTNGVELRAALDSTTAGQDKLILIMNDIYMVKMMLIFLDH